MAWYNESWTKRVKVTIDHTKVGATLSDFPVYIDLSELPADFHTNCNQTDARDIRVTTSDEVTEVPREVVFYDSTTDTGELHFKAPSLSSSADTDFYIYYGNTSATEPAVDATYGRNNVWAGVYKSVLHLNESSGNPIESSGKVSATFSGSLPDAQAGQIGNGQDFDGDGDYVELANDSDLDCTNQSLSFWLKADSFSTHKSFYARRTSNTDGEMLFYYTTTSSINWDTAGSGKRWNTGYTPPIDGTKILIHLTFDGSVKRLYVNGSLNANTASDIHSLLNANTVGRIGSDTQSSQYHVDGLMDEFRLSGETLSADWISTEYNNQSAPNTFYTTGVAESMPVEDWYNASWGYRVKITVQSSQVDATLTDFPVYVDLSSLPIGFHANVNQTDGRDIRVTKADGLTELPREVVFYDSSTDTGELHFKADSLSSSVNTDFYIYYGNASATEPASNATYGSENVWDSNFEAVYHLQQSPTTAQVDSTANGHDSTGYTGSMDSNDSVSAVIGKGLDFDGRDDDVAISDVSGDFQFTNITASCWVKSSGFSESGSWGVISVGSVSTGGSWGLWILSPSQVPVAHFEGSDNVAYNANGTTDVVDGTYHFIYMINDGSNNKVYVDGAEEGTISTSGKTVKTGTWDLELGGLNTSSRSYQGILDEIRISKTARSTSWMSTEYNNQSSPGTFYNVGTQEEQPVSGTNADSERGLYIQGKSTSSSTTSLYIEGVSISGNSDRGLYISGYSTSNGERGLYIAGSHTLSTDYFNVEFGLAESGNSEIGLYIQGSISADSERGLYIDAYSTDGEDMGLYVVGKVAGSSEVGLYILGSIDRSSDIGLYIEGYVEDSEDMNLYISGSATGDSTVGLYVEGYNTSNEDVSLYIDAYSNASDDILLYIAGVDSGYSDVGLYIEGVGYSDEEVGLYMQGSLTAYADFGLYIEGKYGGTGEARLYIAGIDTGYSDINIYIRGSTQGYYESNLYIEGRAIYGDIGLYIEGKIVVNFGLYIEGEGGDSGEVNLYMSGIESTYNELGLYVQGKVETGASVGLYVEGYANEQVERGIYIWGAESGTSDVGLYAYGKDIGSESVGLYIQGSKNTQAELGLYIEGRAIFEDIGLYIQGSQSDMADMELYVWGKDYGSSEASLYVWGTNTDSSDIGLYVEGKNVVVVSVSLYIAGKISTQFNRGLYISGIAETYAEFGLYIVGKTGYDFGLYIIGIECPHFEDNRTDWNSEDLDSQWKDNDSTNWSAESDTEKWYNSNRKQYEVDSKKTEC